MAKLFPELVFTRGPQKGQRAPLSKTMNIIGRDRTCDIELLDEYASRQHARVIVEGPRVRLVNLSPNGTKLNGKVTEQAVLNHGDLIGFGLECEVRYESADGEPAPKPGGAAPATTMPLPAAPAGQAAAGPTAAAQPQAPAPAKPLKKPKTAMFVGIYFVGLLVLFGLLKLLTDAPTKSPPPTTVFLTDVQIEKYLDKPLPKAEKNPYLGKKAIEEAVGMFEAWETGTTGTNHLYKTLRKFKEALAYLQAEDFGQEICQLQTGEKIRIQDMFKKIAPTDVDVEKPRDVLGILRRQISTLYKDAYSEQRQGHRQKAIDRYMELANMIGEPTDPIWQNIRAHLNVVQTNLLWQKERSGQKSGL